MKIGDAIVFVDTRGVERAALVTQVWPGMNGGKDGVNLVFVSGDDTRTDGCGRQTERATSVPHVTGQPAPGNSWREV